MGDRKSNVKLSAVNLIAKRMSKLPVKRRFQVSQRMRNVELGAAKLAGQRTSKLPVKRRSQVSVRMSSSLPWLRREVNGSDSEEDGDTSDEVELSSGSDTEASDRDEENVASGYLADIEMEPRRRQRVSRIQPRLKSKLDRQ